MVDINKIRAVFFEEAAERLSDLEEGILRLEDNKSDRELMNTIFRAAHTIKGSSAGVGFKEISDFTHHLEGVLDLMREGRLEPVREVIDTLLEAVDMMKEMLEDQVSERPHNEERIELIKKKIDNLRDSEEVMAEKDFRVVFSPSPDLFKRGIDPAAIIEDLGRLGKIINIKADTEAVPSLSEIDPERLYLKWDIILRTKKNPEELEEVFEFVEEDSEIKIIPVIENEEVDSYMTPLGEVLIRDGLVKSQDVADALKEQKRIGEILIEKGKVSKEEVEKALEKQRNQKADSFKSILTSSIRVDLRKLDHLINIVGEMVIVHSMFQQVLSIGDGLKTGMNDSNLRQVEVLFSQLQRIGRDIQEIAMSLRMIPIGEVFHRFRRLVRELSESQGKKINLIITGEDTELDKGVLEKITDPLVHLLRNAIDHGIESEEERIRARKDPHGTIYLSAYQRGDSVFIEVEDDGRGMNKERIIEKALSKGIITEPKITEMSDDQIYNLVFLPGFSTSEKVTDLSGRGVGMDVVKRNIESLNGKVFLKTAEGKGTTISIKLPLTLAIMEGLTVLIGEETFVIPITTVQESLRPERSDLRTVAGTAEVLNVRGEYVPLIRLYDVFGITPWYRDPNDATVIVTASEGGRYALMIDAILGEQQIVIKNLGSTPRRKGIMGGTILGNGKVALVLDVQGIIEMWRERGEYATA